MEALRRILIVDDDPTMLRGYSLVLKSGAYHVLEAQTGTAALEMAERERPDLVLLDVVLPDVDGLEVCRRIRGNDTLADVFVVLLSGLKTASEEQAMGLEIGADGYIARPISNRELLARIQAMLRIRDAKIELRERERQHRTVAELGRFALDTDDLDGLAAHAASLVCDALHISVCGVFEVTPVTRSLRMKAGVRKISTTGESISVAFALDAVDPASFDLARPVVVRDLSSDSAWTQRIGPPAEDGGAMAWTPISVRGIPLGVLLVLAETVRDFSANETLFLESVAQILSSAMERRRMNEALVRSSKLEATAFLGGGIAHDFNNILGIITASTGILRSSPALDPSLLPRVRDIETAALRAGRLTRTFIALSSGGKPVKRLVSIRDLLTSTACIVFRDSNIKVEFQFQETEDGAWDVELDEGQMSQALCCLLLNAKEAMPEGGKVRVAGSISERGREKPVDRSTAAQDRYLCITLADEGKGIPKEHLSRIFDPYFSTKATQNVKGQGLGLTTAHSIITRHGGFIEVESEVKTGTCFRIWLPAERIKPRPRLGLSSTKTSGLGKTLVMEEDEGYRSMVGKLLSILGYTDVELARDGQEAITRFEASIKADHPFDIAILEQGGTGGIGGKEILPRLREMRPSLRAILSCASASEPAISDPGSFGFNRVLVKPYRLEDLREAMGVHYNE